MKKSVIKNITLITGVVGSMSFAQAALAEQGKNIYVVPSVGYHIFDNDLSLDDKVSYGFALGRELNNNWAVELAYNTSSTESAIADIDADYLHLDALYNFRDAETDSKWTPYAVFGVGSMSYDGGVRDTKDTQLNAGLGIKYAFNSCFSLRADVRGLLVADDVEESTLVNIGLVHTFGSKKDKPKPVAAPVAAPAPVAKPVAEVAPKDTDGDGVFDSKDKCPDTSKGAKVDADGCYVALKGDKEITLHVKFQTNKAVLEPASKSQVADLAAFLTEYPQTTVVVEGHTDSVGSAEYNKVLSQKRAEAVKQSLIADYAIEAARVSSVGYGEEKPIADNATKEGQAQNRRVVAKVSTKK
jgi:OOP family OmpA-OmpF porin